MKQCCPYLAVWLLAGACQTTIDVDVPRNPARLTANALFTPDSLWQVELTGNRYILDTARFAPVPDAGVRVMQGGNTVAVLEYVGDERYYGNSIYRAKDGRPQVGREYSLEITRPGMGTLTAGSRVPAQTPLLSVGWDTLDTRSDPLLTTGRVAYGVTVRFADPPGKNFYSLSLVVRGYQIGPGFINGQPRDLIARELVTAAGIQSDDPVVDNPFGSYRGELLFKDVSFDGQEYTLKLYMQEGNAIQGGLGYLGQFTKPSLFSGATIYNPAGEVINPPGTILSDLTLYAVLRTTTEEYYRYHYTRDLQASVEKNPFAQPVQVYNNIGNGLGIFAGYSQMVKQATFK